MDNDILEGGWLAAGTRNFTKLSGRSRGKARVKRRASALVPLLSAALAISGPAEASPSLACQANEAAANRASEQAVQSARELKKGGVAIGVGGGCLLLSAGVGGMDFWVAAFICTLVAGGTYLVLTPQESAEIATKAYMAVRRKDCL